MSGFTESVAAPGPEGESEQVLSGGSEPTHPPVTSHEVTAALMSEHAPVFVGLIDQDELVVDAGGALAEQLGYRRDLLVGRPVEEMTTDSTILTAIRRGLSGQEVTDTTVARGRRWLVATKPLRDDEEAVAGVVCVLAFADEADVQRRFRAHEADLERFEALVELSKDFIAMADFDGTVTFLNRAGRDLVGLETDEEVLGRPTDDYSTEAGRARSQEIEAAVREQGYWEGESELRHFRTGESIPVSVNSFLVTRSSDGAPLALATVQRDLRVRLEAERRLALRAQEQRDLAELGRLALTRPLAELMEQAVARIEARFPGLAAGIWASHGDHQLQMVATSDPAWVDRVIAVDKGSISGRAVFEDRCLSTEDLINDPRFPSRSAASSAGARGTLVCPIPGVAGPWGIVGVTDPQVRSWAEEEIGLVESVAATLGAAVRRFELESQLQHQALHDSLTGLPNRALALDRIQSALGRSERRGTMLAVLLLDLDDFKTVNDSLGHGVGDRLLGELSTRFVSAVQAGDTVARLGGDEFVVVCEDVHDEDQVAFVAEALLEACADSLVIDGRRLSVSASIGVALAVAGQGNATRLLSEADIAMYRAKRDRPGTYRIFDEAMRGDVLGRINVAGALRTAVRTGAIGLAFQPIVDLGTGDVVALEALARWSGDDGEAVPPDVFIPVAEETGLIGELGAGVLREAARQAAAWQESGPGVGLRVNVSAHELRDRRYVDHILVALADAGLSPHLLGLEITESTLVTEDRTTQENLVRLEEAGVGLLVDDFGTGYSSLSYLQRFPVIDVLKVDRSFLGEGDRGRAVVRAVVGLGRAFGFRVCAEGVETAEQHGFLMDLGCDLAQGYHLARPVPPEHVAGLLSSWPERPPGT